MIQNLKIFFWCKVIKNAIVPSTIVVYFQKGDELVTNCHRLKTIDNEMVTDCY